MNFHDIYISAFVLCVLEDYYCAYYGGKRTVDEAINHAKEMAADSMSAYEMEEAEQVARKSLLKAAR